jgi:4-hydroxy-tetrahydrodipicolinate synthase
MMGAAAVGSMVGNSALADEPRRLGSSTKTQFWVATVTPCDKNRKFDAAAFKDILAWFKQNGADGIVVLGTTGEFPSFSVEERKKIAEVALKDKMGMNIIIGPGTSNLPETIDLSKHAEASGADGLLVIPPFYYKKPPTKGLISYYSALFDQVNLPINLYHIPGTSGVPISHALLKALMHYPNLAGIKDSNGPPAEYAEFVAAFPQLNMRTGTENNLEYALAHGMGAICMDGNLFTKPLAKVFAAYRAGKDYHAPYEEYAAMRKMMGELKTGIDDYGPMKYALSLQMGGKPTYARWPSVDVTDAQMAAIKVGVGQMKAMA